MSLTHLIGIFCVDIILDRLEALLAKVLWGDLDEIGHLGLEDDE